MNILIIEDEMPSAKRLAKMISKIIPSANVEGPLASIDEVIENLSVRNNYDLIFSDIQLVDGEVFKAFDRVMPQALVIFTTAYNEFAMEAIRHNGFDYLLKPIDICDLKKAIEKLELIPNTKQYNSMADKAALNETTSNFDTHNSKTKFQRVLVQEKNLYIPIRVTDIAYIRISERKKVVVRIYNVT